MGLQRSRGSSNSVSKDSDYYSDSSDFELVEPQLLPGSVPVAGIAYDECLSAERHWFGLVDCVYRWALGVLGFYLYMVICPFSFRRFCCEYNNILLDESTDQAVRLVYKGVCVDSKRAEEAFRGKTGRKKPENVVSHDTGGF